MINIPCLDISAKTFAKILIELLIFGFIFSFLISFFGTSSLDRYKDALKYIENDENNYNWFNSKFPTQCFNFTNEIMNDFSNVNYLCIIDGEIYEKHGIVINSNSLFKKWKSIELSFSILRLIIISFYLISLIIILKKYFNRIYDEGIDNQKIKKSLTIYFVFMMILLFLLDIFTLVIESLRKKVNETNKMIGLYKRSSDDFQNLTDINIAADYAIAIFFLPIIFISSLTTVSYNREINRNSGNGFNSPNNNAQNTQQNQGNYEASAQNNSIGTSPMGNNINIIQSEELRIQQNS